MRIDIKFNQKVISLEKMSSKIIKDTSFQLFVNLKRNKDKPMVKFLKAVYAQW